MSLFGDNPAGGQSDLRPSSPGPRAAVGERYEYDVVLVDRWKTEALAKVMNERGAKGWRVVSTEQILDFSGRGRELLITFERLARS